MPKDFGKNLASSFTTNVVKKPLKESNEDLVEILQNNKTDLDKLKSNFQDELGVGNLKDAINFLKENPDLQEIIKLINPKDILRNIGSDIKHGHLFGNAQRADEILTKYSGSQEQMDLTDSWDDLDDLDDLDLDDMDDDEDSSYEIEGDTYDNDYSFEVDGDDYDIDNETTNNYSINVNNHNSMVSSSLLSLSRPLNSIQETLTSHFQQQEEFQEKVISRLDAIAGNFGFKDDSYDEDDYNSNIKIGLDRYLNENSRFLDVSSLAAERFLDPIKQFFSEDGKLHSAVGFVAQMAGDPIGFAIGKGMEKMIPEIIETTSEELSKHLKDISKSFLFEMAMGARGFGNVFQRTLGQFFGVNIDLDPFGNINDRGFVKKEYQHKTVQFDSVTKMAIEKTIPGYLAEILNTVRFIATHTGVNGDVNIKAREEALNSYDKNIYLFDYKTGSFTTKDQIQKKKEGLLKTQIDSVMSPVTNEILNGIEESRDYKFKRQMKSVKEFEEKTGYDFKKEFSNLQDAMVRSYTEQYEEIVSKYNEYIDSIEELKAKQGDKFDETASKKKIKELTDKRSMISDKLKLAQLDPTKVDPDQLDNLFNLMMNFEHDEGDRLNNKALAKAKQLKILQENRSKKKEKRSQGKATLRRKCDAEYDRITDVKRSLLSRIRTLDSRVTDKISEIDNLDSQIFSIENEIARLNEDKMKIDKNYTGKDSIIKEMSNIKAKIRAKNKLIKVYEKEISKINNSKKYVRNTKKQLKLEEELRNNYNEVNLAEGEERIDENFYINSEIEREFKSISEKVEKGDTLKAVYENKIRTHENEIVKLQNRYNELKARKEEIEKKTSRHAIKEKEKEKDSKIKERDKKRDEMEKLAKEYDDKINENKKDSEKTYIMASHLHNYDVTVSTLDQIARNHEDNAHFDEDEMIEQLEKEIKSAERESSLFSTSYNSKYLISEEKDLDNSLQNTLFILQKSSDKLAEYGYRISIDDYLRPGALNPRNSGIMYNTFRERVAFYKQNYPDTFKKYSFANAIRDWGLIRRQIQHDPKIITKLHSSILTQAKFLADEMREEASKKNLEGASIEEQWNTSIFKKNNSSEMSYQDMEKLNELGKKHQIINNSIGLQHGRMNNAVSNISNFLGVDSNGKLNNSILANYRDQHILDSQLIPTLTKLGDFVRITDKADQDKYRSSYETLKKKYEGKTDSTEDVNKYIKNYREAMITKYAYDIYNTDKSIKSFEAAKKQASDILQYFNPRTIDEFNILVDSINSYSADQARLNDYTKQRNSVETEMNNINAKYGNGANSDTLNIMSKDLKDIIESGRKKDENGNYIYDKNGNYIYVDQQARAMERTLRELFIERDKKDRSRSSVQRRNFINKNRLIQLNDERKKLAYINSLNDMGAHRGSREFREIRDSSRNNPKKNAYAQILEEQKDVRKKLKDIYKKERKYEEEFIEMENASEDFKKQALKMKKKRMEKDERYESYEKIYDKVKGTFQLDVDWIPLIGPIVSKVANEILGPIGDHAKTLLTWISNSISLTIDDLKKGLSEFIFGNDTGIVKNLKEGLNDWIHDEKNPLSGFISEKNMKLYKEKKENEKQKMLEMQLKGNSITQNVYEELTDTLKYQKSVFGNGTEFNTAMHGLSTPGSAYVNSVEANVLLNNIFAFLTGHFDAENSDKYKISNEEDLEKQAHLFSKTDLQSTSEKIKDQAVESSEDEYKEYIHYGYNISKEQKKENRKIAKEKIIDWFDGLQGRLTVGAKARLAKVGTNKSLFKEIDPDTDERYNAESSVASLAKGRLKMDIIDPFKKFLIGSKVSEEERKELMEEGLIKIIQNSFENRVVNPFRKALLGDEDDNSWDDGNPLINTFKLYAKLKVLDPIMDLLKVHTGASFNPSWMQDYKSGMNQLEDEKAEKLKIIESTNSTIKNMRLIDPSMNKGGKYVIFNDKKEFAEVSDPDLAIERYNSLQAEIREIDAQIEVTSKRKDQSAEKELKDLRARKEKLVEISNILTGEKGTYKIKLNGKNKTVNIGENQSRLFAAYKLNQRTSERLDQIDQDIEVNKKYMIDKKARNMTEFKNLQSMNNLRYDSELLKGSLINGKYGFNEDQTTQLQSVFRFDKNGLEDFKRASKKEYLYDQVLDKSRKKKIAFFKKHGYDKKTAVAYINSRQNNSKDLVTSKDIYMRALNNLRDKSKERMSLSGRIKTALIGEYNDDLNPDSTNYLNTNNSFYDILKAQFIKHQLPELKKLIGGKDVDLTLTFREVLDQKLESVFKKPKIALEKFILGKDNDINDDEEIYQRGLLGVLKYKYNAITDRFKSSLIEGNEEEMKRKGLDIDNKKDSLLSFAFAKLDIEIFDRFKNYLIGDDKVAKEKYADKSLLFYVTDNFKENVIDKTADILLGEKDSNGKRTGALAEFWRNNDTQLKKMGFGALAGHGLLSLLIGGTYAPIVGSVLGLVAGTDEFKEEIFSKDNPASVRNQLIYKIIGKDEDKFKNMNGQSFMSFLFKRLEISVLDPIKLALFGSKNNKTDIEKRYRLGLLEELKYKADEFIFLTHKSYVREKGKANPLEKYSRKEKKKFEKAKDINQRIKYLENEVGVKDLSKNIRTILSEDLYNEGVNYNHLGKRVKKILSRKYKKLNKLGSKDSSIIADIMYDFSGLIPAIKNTDLFKKTNIVAKEIKKRLKKAPKTVDYYKDKVIDLNKKIDDYRYYKETNRKALKVNDAYTLLNRFKTGTPLKDISHISNILKLKKYNRKRDAKNADTIMKKNSMFSNKFENKGLSKNEEIALAKMQLEGFFGNLASEVTYQVNKLFKGIGKTIGKLLHTLLFKVVGGLLKKILNVITFKAASKIGGFIRNRFQNAISKGRNFIGNVNDKLKARRLDRFAKDMYGDEETAATMMDSDTFKNELMKNGKAKLHNDYWQNKEKKEKYKNEGDLVTLKKRLKDNNFTFDINDETDRTSLDILKTGKYKDKYKDLFDEKGNLRSDANIDERVLKDAIEGMYTRNAEIRDKASRAKLHPERFDFNGNEVLTDDEKHEQKIFENALHTVAEPTLAIKTFLESVIDADQSLKTSDGKMFNLVRRLTDEEVLDKSKNTILDNLTDDENKLMGSNLFSDISRVTAEDYEDKIDIDDIQSRYRSVVDSVLNNFMDQDSTTINKMIDSIKTQSSNLDISNESVSLSDKDKANNVRNSLIKIASILEENTGPEGSHNCINTHDYHLVEAVREGFQSLGGHVNKNINEADMDQPSNTTLKPDDSKFAQMQKMLDERNKSIENIDTPLNEINRKFGKNIVNYGEENKPLNLDTVTPSETKIADVQKKLEERNELINNIDKPLNEINKKYSADIMDYTKAKSIPMNDKNITDYTVPFDLKVTDYTSKIKSTNPEMTSGRPFSTGITDYTNNAKGINFGVTDFSKPNDPNITDYTNQIRPVNPNIPNYTKAINPEVIDYTSESKITSEIEDLKKKLEERDALIKNIDAPLQEINKKNSKDKSKGKPKTTALKKLATKVLSPVMKVLGPIGATIKNTVDTISTVIEAGKEIVGFVKDVPNKIKNGIETIKSIPGKVKEKVNAIKSIPSKVKKKVTDTIEKGREIKNKIKSIPSNIKNKVTNTIEKGKEIKNKITSIPGAVRDKINNTKEKINNTIEKGKEIKDKIKSGFTSIKDKLSKKSKTGIDAINDQKKKDEKKKQLKIFSNIETNTAESSKSLKDVSSIKGKFSALKTFFVTLFTKFIKPIGSGILSLIKKIPSGLSSLGSLASKAGSGISSLFGGGATAAASAEGAAATTAASGASAGAAGILGPILSVVGGAVVAIGTTISDYKKGKENGYTGGKLAATTLLGEAGDSFKDTLLNAGKQALKYGGLGLAIGTIVPGIGNLLGAGVGALIGLIGGLFGNDPKKSLDNLKTGFTSIGEKLKSTFTSIGSSIKEKLSSIGPEVLSCAKEGFSLGGKFIPGIGSVLGGALGGLIGLFGSLFGGKPSEGIAKIKDGLSSIGTKLKESFSSIISGLGEKISEGSIGKVLGAITGVFAKVKDLIVNSFNWVKEKVGPIFTNIKESVSTFFSNSIEKFFTEFIPSVKEKISNIFEKVKDFFSTIKKIFSSIGKFISGIFKSDAVQNAKETVSTGISKFKDTVSSLASSVLDGIKNTVSSVGSGIKSVISSVKSFGSSVIDKVTNKDSTTSLLNSAKDTIKSTSSAVFNTTKGVISNSLLGKAVSYFKGNSEDDDTTDSDTTVDNNDVTPTDITSTSTASASDYQSSLIENVTMTNSYLSSILDVLNQMNTSVSAVYKSTANNSSSNNSEIATILKQIYNVLNNNSNGSNDNDSERTVNQAISKLNDNNRLSTQTGSKSSTVDNFFLGQQQMDNSTINLKQSTINIAKGK